MVGLLIVWGVLTSNAQQREIAYENTPEEDHRDVLLAGYLFLTWLLWPFYGVLYGVRHQKIWYLALIPLVAGLIVWTSGAYALYAGIGLLALFAELVRISWVSEGR